MQIAKQLKADRVIIDENIGRDVAEYLGLKVTGTRGILLKAKQNGWIESFKEGANDMSDQGIHYNKALIKKLAKVIGEN